MKTFFQGVVVIVAAGSGMAAQAVAQPAAVSDLTSVLPTGSTEDRTLTWTVPAGGATGYQVAWSGAPFTPDQYAAANLWFENPLPITAGAAGSEEVFHIGPFPREAQLYFAVKSRNAAGTWSAPSNVAATVVGEDDDTGGNSRPLCGGSAAGSAAIGALGAIGLLVMWRLK